MKKLELNIGLFEKELERVYGNDCERQKKRWLAAIDEFEAIFGSGRDLVLFSAPGRTEIGGNHTDHQHGRVLAASINLDVIGVASLNNDGIIRIKSANYKQDDIDLAKLEPQEKEREKAASLIRGMAAGFAAAGFKVGGFDMYTTSEVLKGSGLSSSAAFEMIVGTAINTFFAGGALQPMDIAKLGQKAENNFFGKPSGLMDQAASAIGGFVCIDFKDNTSPVVEKLDFDLSSAGYTLCIVDTGGSHADLTNEYAAIPGEMKKIAAHYGCSVLREVDAAAFRKDIPLLREKFGDRAVLRALHFFAENDRVVHQANALKADDFGGFLGLVNKSGDSSYKYLQNVYCCISPNEQGLSLALNETDRILAGRGACRVHGGGFGGTIQAYIPNELVEEYKNSIEGIFGEGHCKLLSVRPFGAIKLNI
ncbi:MAG: galactokinase [Oscillospiraceae bacterium]|nr:galactokinase [Oscillospiraceae bacterium]MBQ3048835.1 galactokinase [Oscillospiraceae bacterium]MBQ9938719.1 galactokinase [Oscillospiraceae bacterium]